MELAHCPSLWCEALFFCKYFSSLGPFGTLHFGIPTLLIVGILTNRPWLVGQTPHEPILLNLGLDQGYGPGHLTPSHRVHTYRTGSGNPDERGLPSLG
jgi:hypothetical protein